MKLIQYRLSFLMLASMACLLVFAPGSPTYAADTATAQPSDPQWIASQQAFLKENATKSGWKTSPTGLEYHQIEAASPTAQQPKLSDKVTVLYIGTLTNGKTFDSEWGKSLTFPLNKVIKGWQEAVQMMHVGETWEFAIPPDLAYGHKGAGNLIPPDSVLLFKIKLIGVQPQ